MPSSNHGFVKANITYKWRQEANGKNAIARYGCNVRLRLKNKSRLGNEKNSHHVLQNPEAIKVMKLHFFPVSTKGKGNVLPYSLPSVGPVTDPRVQAVSPQAT